MPEMDEQIEALVAPLKEQIRALLVARRRQGELDPEELASAVRAVFEPTERAAYVVATEMHARYEAAPVCPGCRRPMQRHDRVARVLVTAAGERRGVYQRWRCRACRCAACPTWEAAGVRHGCGRALAARLTQLGTLLPFETAERVLACWGPPVSDNTIARLCRDAGSQRALGDVPAPGAARAPQRLYVLVDGATARVERHWREFRVAVIYETDCAGLDARGRPPQARWRRVLAGLWTADECAEHVAAELERLGADHAREVVCCADGAAWIWDRLRALVPPWVKCVEVLDWYHATENLGKAVRAVYGEQGNELEFKRLRAWLRLSNHGDLQRRLAELEQQARGADAQRVVANVRRYCQTHRARMDYLRLPCDGYYIGSGSVESACKQIKGRLAGPGMNWSKAGFDAMLQLVSDEFSARRPIPIAA